MLRHIKRAANGSILETTAGYRTSVGVLGVLLSPVLVIYGLVRNVPVQASISAYYHQTSTRDWFVGTLFVIGMFLFFYKYTPGLRPAKSNINAVRTGHLDAWSEKPPESRPSPWPSGRRTIPTEPGPSAVTCTMSQPSPGRLPGAVSVAPVQQLRDAPGELYKAIGWSMLAILGIALAWLLVDAKTQPLLAIETALITLFGWSWFAKGRDQANAP